MTGAPRVHDNAVEYRTDLQRNTHWCPGFGVKAGMSFRRFESD